VNSSNGIVLWSLGAAGTLLVYSAFKNVKPQAVLAHYFTGTAYSAADKIQASSNGGGKPLIQATTPGGTPLNQTPNINNLFGSPPLPSKTNGGNSDISPSNPYNNGPGGYQLGAFIPTAPANFGSPTYIGGV
jgi:hypothetical protein